MLLTQTLKGDETANDSEELILLNLIGKGKVIYYTLIWFKKIVSGHRN